MSRLKYDSENAEQEVDNELLAIKERTVSMEGERENVVQAASGD